MYLSDLFKAKFKSKRTFVENEKEEKLALTVEMRFECVYLPIEDYDDISMETLTGLIMYLPS